MNRIRVEKKIGKSTFSFETGALAKQAAGAVLAKYGDTVVLVAAATDKPRAGIDFFPLTCDYRERTAAAGKFPGGFIKREGRPTTKETLTARLMDRSEDAVKNLQRRALAAMQRGLHGTAYGQDGST